MQILGHTNRRTGETYENVHLLHVREPVDTCGFVLPFDHNHHWPTFE
jgi:hypothetical protein